MNIKINFQAGVSYQDKEKILKSAAANSIGIKVDELENFISKIKISLTKGSIEFEKPSEQQQDLSEEIEKTPEQTVDQKTSSKTKLKKGDKMKKQDPPPWSGIGIAPEQNEIIL